MDRRNGRKGLGENISIGTVVALIVVVAVALVLISFSVPFIRNKITTTLTAWVGSVTG
ncbi:MAG: hypothetical protein SVW77_02680 [Candidatus Nanohaloarchaea archaeon]|nr:hypothetical protein [Candidatus Nanohaloarchaea archaeon]